MQTTPAWLSSAVALMTAITGAYLASATVSAAPMSVPVPVPVPAASTVVGNLLGRPAAVQATWSITYRRVRACGKTLADLLQNICHEGYNESDDDDDDYDPAVAVAIAAHSIADDDARKKSTITRECCQQACDLRELFRYCRNATSANDRLSRQIAADAKSSLEPLYIYIVRTDRDRDSDRNSSTSAQLNLKAANRYNVYKTSGGDDDWHSQPPQINNTLNMIMTTVPTTTTSTTAASSNATTTAVTYNEWNVRKKKDPYLKRNTPIVFRSAAS